MFYSLISLLRSYPNEINKNTVKLYQKILLKIVIVIEVLEICCISSNKDNLGNWIIIQIFKFVYEKILNIRGHIFGILLSEKKS